MRDRTIAVQALLRRTLARYARDEGGNIILLFGEGVGLLEKGVGMHPA